VNVKKFRFTSPEMKVVLKDIGPGTGMVEDGRGIWI